MVLERRKQLRLFVHFQMEQLSPSSFDAFKLLGPSLAQVLTRSLDQQTQQEDEKDVRNGNEISDDDTPPHLSDSNSSLKPSLGVDLQLSRCAWLGKLVSPSVDTQSMIQEYFLKMLSSIQCEATGLVLLNDTTVVMFLETKTEAFVPILEQLQHQSIINIESIKILANCDDYGPRFLQSLHFEKIGLNRNNVPVCSDDDNQTTQCVIETFLNLVKLVKRIGSMVPEDSLTDVLNEDQTVLPSNDLVLWLLERDELMTIEEYLDFFNAPVAIQLESERVHSVHPLAHYAEYM